MKLFGPGICGPMVFSALNPRIDLLHLAVCSSTLAFGPWVLSRTFTFSYGESATWVFATP